MPSPASLTQRLNAPPTQNYPIVLQEARKTSRLETLLLSGDRQSFYPYQVVHGGDILVDFRRNGVHEMISRIAAGIFSAAALSLGLLTAAPIMAEAQTPSPDQAQAPEQAA